MKTGIGKTEESTGIMPAMGVKLKIKSLEKGETKEASGDGWSRAGGLRQYTVRYEVVEPKKYKGVELIDWFTVGTDEDKKAKNEETWQRGGKSHVARLKRLFVRSGFPAPDDDEEWGEIAGYEVCAHVKVKTKQNGTTDNAIDNDNSYFRESDEDFAGIGERLADAGSKAKPAAAPKRKPVEDDEDEPVKAKTKPTAEEEEPPKKAAKKGKPADDDDDD